MLLLAIVTGMLIIVEATPVYHRREDRKDTRVN